MFSRLNTLILSNKLKKKQLPITLSRLIYPLYNYFFTKLNLQHPTNIHVRKYINVYRYINKLYLCLGLLYFNGFIIIQRNK
jgi:hypothetical protein